MTDYKLVPVARAIWEIRREWEDRCDMELEDIGLDHPVWSEAKAAIQAMLAAAPDVQGDPVATIHVDGSFVHVEWHVRVPLRCSMDVYTAPPSASVGVEGYYHPCTSILIEGLKQLKGGGYVLAKWNRARAKVDTALAALQSVEKQPLPCQECGGDGAGGEHEEDCTMAQPAPDVSALVEALERCRHQASYSIGGEDALRIQLGKVRDIVNETLSDLAAYRKQGGQQ